MTSRVDSFLESLNDKPTTKKTPRQWKPMLGQMLEYGDSGFVIVLQKNSKRAPFSLRDPDGRELATGDKLPAMKAYAEEQARFRDEFDMGASDLSLPDWNKLKGD